MLYLIYERYVVPLSVLIPIIIAFYNYQYLNKILKLLIVFLFFSGFLDLAAVVMASHSIPNLWLLHIYTIFEFAFISWFYKMLLKGLTGKIIPFIVVVFSVICIVNFLFIQNNIEFNTYTRPVSAVLIIAYCIIYFSAQNNDYDNISWGDISFNWITTGILIFYSCSFFTFIFSNYLLAAGKHINNIIWGTYDTILLFEYILFGIGFYKCRKQQIIYSS